MDNTVMTEGDGTAQCDDSSADATQDDEAWSDACDKPDDTSEKDNKEMALGMGDHPADKEEQTGFVSSPKIGTKDNYRAGDVTDTDSLGDVIGEKDEPKLDGITAANETNINDSTEDDVTGRDSELEEILKKYQRQSEESEFWNDGTTTEQNGADNAPRRHVTWQIGETGPTVADDREDFDPEEPPKEILDEKNDQQEASETDLLTSLTDNPTGVSTALAMTGKVLAAVGAPSISSEQLDELGLDADEYWNPNSSEVISNALRSTIPLATVMVPNATHHNEESPRVEFKQDVSSQTSYTGINRVNGQNTERQEPLSESGPPIVSVDELGDVESQTDGDNKPDSGICIPSALWAVLPVAAIAVPDVAIEGSQHAQNIAANASSCDNEQALTDVEELPTTVPKKRNKICKVMRLFSYVKPSHYYTVVRKDAATAGRETPEAKDWSPFPGSGTSASGRTPRREMLASPPPSASPISPSIPDTGCYKLRDFLKIRPCFRSCRRRATYLIHEE